MPKNPIPEVNNLFLLGTGFTKAVFDDAPLNDELLEKLISRYPQSPLVEYQCRYHAKNIEVILTQLDLETVDLQSERLKQDRQKINNEIAEYFQQFRFGNHKEELEACGWLKSFATEVFGCNDAIVTLNYDCLLDGVLDYHEAWSPSKGYGAADVKVNVPGTGFEKLPNPKNILVYKIHGSENFQTCRIKDVHIDPNHIGLVVKPEIYPKYGANSNLGVVEGRSYIIAPSFVKTFYPQIERMMIGALQAAGKAKNFIIIGCGLRPEDSFLWLLLTSFFNQLPTERKFVIVDPNAEKLAKKTVDHYFEDINNLVNIRLFSEGLESVIEELIRELHENKI